MIPGKSGDSSLMRALSTEEKNVKQYLKLMRVHHYIKNLLIFAALGCSGQLFHTEKLGSVCLGFLAFCLVTSVVYIINDIRDVEKDRNHPTKRHRPIASGSVSLPQAWLLCAALLAAGFFCAALVGVHRSVLLLGLYLVLNLAYSFGLKNYPILDITILVSGFLIRVLYGAVITDITISNWLYLTVVAVSCYFSLGKRRNELQRLGENHSRKVLTAYSLGFLDKSMGMCLTMTNVFYALWSMDPNTLLLYNGKNMVFTVPLVLIITLKYSLRIEGDSDGDPVEVLLHDRVLLLLCVIYLVTIFAILYL